MNSLAAYNSSSSENQLRTSENKHFFQDCTFLAVPEEACKTRPTAPIHSPLRVIKPTSGLLEGAGEKKTYDIYSNWLSNNCSNKRSCEHIPFCAITFNTSSALLCPFLSQISMLISPILCFLSVRSRYAEFQFNCQPSLQAASGCRRDSYAACLLAYTGIIGELVSIIHVSYFILQLLSLPHPGGKHHLYSGQLKAVRMARWTSETGITKNC